MKLTLRLLLVQAFFASSVWAAGFTAHYVSAGRQLWFVQPSAEKGSYRICVTIFGPDGAPQREVVALQASYAAGIWSMNGGWEINLAPDTLELGEVNQVNGPYPEFTLDPSSAADPRIVTIGRGLLFSEHAMPPNYANFSLFTVNPKTGLATYVFARRAVLNVTNGQTSGSLSKVLTATISADANAPMIGLTEESQF